jgi:histidinol-phosphate phosphatase family protein
MSPAVFLDRDGTVIEHVHHLTRPEDVALIDGAAGAIAELSAKGFLCVLVTNQSVVGRGMLDMAGLDRVHARMNELLLDQGAKLDGIYVCVEVPQGDDQTKIEHPDRKPGPGMLLKAARDLDIDLGRSWMVGDSSSDLWAGRNAGCRESLLVLTGYGQRTFQGSENQWRAVPSIVQAAKTILQEGQQETSRARRSNES